MLPTFLLTLSLYSAVAVALPQDNKNDLSLQDVVVRDVAQTQFKVTIGPKPPFRPMPASTPRDRECAVKGGTADDSAAITAAIKSCNGGGRVVFAKETKYTVGKTIDLSALKQIDLDIRGTIVFTPDKPYWSAHALKHTFQDAISFFQIGGSDVNVYGGGTIDGNGGAWGGQGKRPILFAVAGLKGGVIADLNLKDSPQWFNIIRDSQDVVYTNIHIHGKNHNTDGWDTLNSKNIVIQNSRIENGDDCVSFKPGSIDIVVQNLVCSGSHGISVGSLGQYKGQNDIVENVYVYNISMSNASNGARIKTWAGHGTMSGVGSGGGGAGRVNNITFEKFKVSGVKSAIMITQCYGQKDPGLCKSEPSKVTISNILMKDFSGSANGKKGVIGSLECSNSSLCKNIKLQDIHVSGGGISCSNVKPSGNTSCK